MTLGLVFAALIGVQPHLERPLVRLLVGSGIQAEPQTPLLTVYPDGRFVAEDHTGQKSPTDVASLRAAIRRVEKVTQEKLDEEIQRSGVPSPSMRNTSPLYGIEIATRLGYRTLHLREPAAYRGKGLAKAEAFIVALEALAAYGGIQIKI